METKKVAIYVVIIILIAALGSYFYISANSHNTKIEMRSNGTLKNGDFVSVILTDEYRNVYPNEVIDVKILDDSGWAHKYQVKTDDSGIANVELLTFENGNYTVHSNYNGTLFNHPCKSVDKLVIDDGF